MPKSKRTDLPTAEELAQRQRLVKLSKNQRVAEAKERRDGKKLAWHEATGTLPYEKRRVIKGTSTIIDEKRPLKQGEEAEIISLSCFKGRRYRLNQQTQRLFPTAISADDPPSSPPMTPATEEAIETMRDLKKQKR